MTGWIGVCAWIIAWRWCSFRATATAIRTAMIIGGIIIVISSGRLKTLAIRDPGPEMSWTWFEVMP